MRLDRAGWRVLGVAFVVVAVCACAKLVGRAERLSGDHMTFYVAARSLVEGGNPYVDVPGWYHRYVYPPLFAWAIAPLTVAGPKAYALAWWALLGACWVAAHALVARVLGGPRRAVHPAVQVLPALLLVRPIYNGWGLGQVTAPLLVLLLLALLAIRARRGAVAGAVLGLAGAVKVFPAYLAVVFVRMRRAAPLMALVRTAVLASFLPALTVGLPRLVELLFAWFPASAAVSVESQQRMPNRFSPVTSLWREAGWDWAHVGAAQMAWTVACTLIVLSFPVPRRQRAFWLWCGLVITTMVVTSPMVHTNYLAFLWFPFAAMLHVATTRLPWVAVPAVAAAALFALEKVVSRGAVEAGLLVLWAAQLAALRVLVQEER